jgi:hypothetical protein
MNKIRFGFAGIMGVALLGAAVCADEGKEFRPKNGRFTITFPKAQKSGDRQQVVSLGAPPPAAAPPTRRGGARRAPLNANKMPIEASYAILKDGTKFNAGSAGIPVAYLRGLQLDQRFELFSDSFIKSLDGKVTDESDIKQGSIPGKRYQIKGGNGVIRMDLYLYAGWVMFALVDGKTKDDLESKEAKAFFDSFKLTPPDDETKKDDSKKDDAKKDPGKN